MDNMLHIDLYKDGFNNFGINCVDEAIAYASGYYDYTNYFTYCFEYGLSINWNEIYFPRNQNSILANLGLISTRIDAPSPRNIKDIISQQIEKNMPVCVVLDYYHLFYNNEFYKRLHTPHGVVISGYDSDRSIVTIRENCHIGWKQPFYEFNIDIDIFTDIYEQSSSFFETSSQYFYKNINKLYFCPDTNYFDNCVFAIQTHNTPKIRTFKDLIEEFTATLGLEKNNLSTIAIDMDYLIQLVADYELGAAQFRRNYLESIEMVFSVIEKFSNALDSWPTVLEDYLKFKQHYLKQRSIFVSKILFNAIRRKKFSTKEETALVQDIKRLDRELLEFMLSIESKVDSDILLTELKNPPALA